MVILIICSCVLWLGIERFPDPLFVEVSSNRLGPGQWEPESPGEARACLSWRIASVNRGLVGLRSHIDMRDLYSRVSSAEAQSTRCSAGLNG